MINQYDYYCPKCDSKLNENNQVVFNIKRSSDEIIKLFLDPKPMSYKFRCEPEPLFPFVESEMVDFNCPNCDQSLESDKYSKFVEIILKVTDKVIFEVFFSRIYGDHKTYVGIEDFEEEYGHKIAKH